ncbi:CD2-associated protein-like isoform X1 [Huso huso]|uniref:CD2-associated protein-like isoform X1 n=1 Tax=Huso huso TaxID=61971 RepID=A0ABR0YPV4_HUSHU
MEVFVLMDFEGINDELKIKAGDVIKNVRAGAEQGWMEGELNGKRGFFPSNFVKEIPSYLMGDHLREPRSIRKCKTLKKKQTLCEVAFAYSPLDKDELELKEGEIIEFIKEIEDGWWLGNKNGKIGAFPSNFVKEITETTDGPNSSAVKQRPKLSEALFNKELEKQPQLQHTCGAGQRLDINQDNERCKVMVDYTATAEDELDLKKGDVVVIINKDTDDEGWWEGELNGKHGFFPDNFVMVLPTACLMLENTDRPLRRMLDKSSVSKPGVPAMDIKDCSDHSRPEADLLKDERKDLRSDPPSKQILPPLKKVPPPVKNKPVKNLPSKTNGEIAPLSPKPTEMVKEKAKETDSIHIEDVAVSSDKLSHPTANRAKHQGRRPPSHLVINKTTVEKLLLSPVTPKNDHAASHFPRVTSPLKAIPSQSIPETKPKAERETHENIEELKAEIRELSLGLALLKNQHVRDIVDLKKEMKAEAAKRMALQEEVEMLRKSVNQH